MYGKTAVYFIDFLALNFMFDCSEGMLRQKQLKSVTAKHEIPASIRRITIMFWATGKTLKAKQRTTSKKGVSFSMA